MAFIKVNDPSDHPVYINIQHIVTVVKEGSNSRVDLDAESNQGRFIITKDTPEEIMDSIHYSVRGDKSY